MRSEEAISFILNELREKLPKTLSYHSFEHTLEVIENVKTIANTEELSDNKMEILLTAAAYHDSGFIRSFENHEFHGCTIAEETLPEYGYSKEEISEIQELIMCTKIPQTATTLTARIICDADLEYLCGDDYDIISRTLCDELIMRGFEIDDSKWLDIQISFLEEHHFWTDYCKNKGDKNKEKILDKLKETRNRI